jgi:hypothetical protein
MMDASIRAIANSTPRGRIDILCQSGGDPAGVGEVPELRVPGERRGGKGHHRPAAEDDDDDPDPQVGLLVTALSGCWVSGVVPCVRAEGWSLRCLGSGGRRQADDLVPGGEA